MLYRITLLFQSKSRADQISFLICVSLNRSEENFTCMNDQQLKPPQATKVSRKALKIKAKLKTRELRNTKAQKKNIGGKGKAKAGCFAGLGD